MAEIVMRRRFQKTRLEENMNREWEIRLYDDGHVETTNGRVESGGQNHDRGFIYEGGMDRLVSEKIRKGYKEIPLAVPQVVVSGLSPVDAKVDAITRFIFTEANESIATTTAAPVDQLSLDQIEKGRLLLTEAMAVVQKYHHTSVPLLYVQEYWNTIPTKLPRKKEDVMAVAASFDVGAEFDRLDQLEAAVKSLVVTQAGGSQYNALGAELTWLDTTNPTRQQIEQFYRRTRAASNGLQIDEVYAVRIPHERERYEASTRGKSFVAPCLTHGTNTAYVRHILREGLRLPRGLSYSPMFGYGIYFGDEVGKSETYLSSPRKRYGGLRSGVPYLMLLCEVALGNIKEMMDEDKSLREAPKGYDSVMGVKGKTLKFHGPERLAYSEYIVYDPAQVTVRALVKLR